MPKWLGTGLLDPTGVVEEGRRVHGSLDRPRVLPPSLSQWVKIATPITTVPATWRSNLAGYGLDFFWDFQTQRFALLNGGIDASSQATVGLSYTDDGVSFEDYGSNPVFSKNPTGGQPDSGTVAFLQIFDYADGEYHAHYIGWPNPGFEQGTPNILKAKAASPRGPWTRQGVKVTPDTIGGGVTSVYRPTTFKLGGTYYMVTNAGPTPGTDEDIYLLESPTRDGPWTLVGKLLDDDLFGSMISDPEFVRWGDLLLLFYWTQGGSPGVKIAWCHAEDFPDPTAWVHNTTPIIPGASGLDKTRMTWAVLPFGPALYVNGGGQTNVELWVPKSSLGAAPRAITEVRHSASQAITTATPTVLDFNTTVRDRGGWFTRPSSKGRITIPTDGVYIVGASVSWAFNATGERFLGLQLNGVAGAMVADDRRSANSVADTDQIVSHPVLLNAGDFIETVVYHTRGSNLNITQNTRGSAGTYRTGSPYMWATLLSA